MFRNKSENIPEAQNSESVDVMRPFEAPLDKIRQEWNIFLTRLENLESAMKGNIRSDQKKALSHAKHAAMCVRDALKEFGRVIL